MSYIKIALVNLLILTFLLLCLSIVCAVYLDYKQFKIDVIINPEDNRINLPAYPDKSYPKAVFRDFGNIGADYKPYVAWQLKPVQSETLNIDDQGRRYDPSQNSEGKRYVVRVFGGSTIFGTGAADGDTIPAKLTKKMDQVYAVNHGVSGYVNRQSLAALTNVLNQKEKTDAVIFYDGVNDVINLCRSDNLSINSHSNETKILEMNEKDRGEKRSSYLHKIFLTSIKDFTERAHKKFFVPEPENPYSFNIVSRCQDNPELMEVLAQTMIENWKLSRAMAKASGAEFIAVLQPVAYVGEPNLEYLTIDEDWREEYEFMYRYWREYIKSKNHDWIIDATQVFNDQEPIYIDWAHVNPAGNEIIANLMAEKLSKALR